jgi:hypothetical protein
MLLLRILLILMTEALMHNADDVDYADKVMVGGFSKAAAAGFLEDDGQPCPPDAVADLKPVSNNSWEDPEASIRSICALSDASLALDLSRADSAHKGTNKSNPMCCHLKSSTAGQQWTNNMELISPV